MTKKDKKYEGWLISNNFWKRAVAVWAYGLVIPAIFLTLYFILILFLFR